MSALPGPGVQADVQGMALSMGDKTAFIPLDVRTYMRPIIALLHDPTRTKVVHDLKATLLAFHRIGVTLAGPYLDTMVADYLLNPNRRDHQLETIAMEVLDHRLGTGQKRNAAPQSLFDEDTGSREEAAEAASVLAKLAQPMTERLSEQGSLTLFTDVEMPLVPVLAEIERNGFLLDVDGLRALSKELERDLDQMIKAIEGLAGGEFNINSPKQLATVLFEKLGLKPIRKTKTGYSTDEDTLTQLATQHELPAQIVNYRSLSKLKSTYVDALPELVNPETKRLHTSLNQTVAATGRLSSTDPNLQNIPVKGEYGLRIQRSVYRAGRPHLTLRRLQPDRASHPRAPVARSALARRVCEGGGYPHGDGHGDFQSALQSNHARYATRGQDGRLRHCVWDQPVRPGLEYRRVRRRTRRNTSRRSLKSFQPCAR